MLRLSPVSGWPTAAASLTATGEPAGRCDARRPSQTGTGRPRVHGQWAARTHPLRWPRVGTRLTTPPGHGLGGPSPPAGASSTAPAPVEPSDRLHRAGRNSGRRHTRLTPTHRERMFATGSGQTVSSNPTVPSRRSSYSVRVGICDTFVPLLPMIAHSQLLYSPVGPEIPPEVRESLLTALPGHSASDVRTLNGVPRLRQVGRRRAGRGHALADVTVPSRLVMSGTTPCPGRHPEQGTPPIRGGRSVPGPRPCCQPDHRLVTTVRPAPGCERPRAEKAPRSEPENATVLTTPEAWVL